MRALQAHETACAGDEAFDHLLGFSLLANGEAEAASWVLERAVVAHPKNGAAWLDLADADLRQGENSRAREALQHAIGLNPPPVAQQKIAAMQEALRRATSRWAFDGYIANETGWDSNVNSATQLLTISAPGYSPLPIKLDPDSRAEGSAYNDVEVGGSLAWHASSDLTLYMLPRIKYRTYLQLHQFDRTITGMQGGAGWQLGSGTLIGLVQSEDQTLGGSEYLHNTGATLEWREPLSPTRQLSLVSQYISARYTDWHMRNYDSDEVLVGVALTQNFLHDRLRWVTAAYRGQDDGVYNRAGGSRRVIIASSDLGYHLTPEWDLHGVLSHEADDYRQADPGFLRPRSESIWNETVALSWQWCRQQTLSADYAFITDDSDIPLYASRRTIVSVGWRFTF